MAATEEKSEAAPPPEKKLGGGGGSKMMVVLTVVNLAITLGIGGVLFLSFQKDKAKTSVEDIKVQGEEHGGGEKKEGEHGAAEKKEGGGGGEHGGGNEHGEGGKGKEETKKSAYGRMVTLEPFTINLSTPGSVNPKFVRVNIAVEVATEDTETEFTQKMPQVRNSVIDLFNSKRPADLATSEGRDYLKEEIRNAFNSFLVTGKVKGVFFTNFALSS